jgi:hypothetical protein
MQGQPAEEPGLTGNTPAGHGPAPQAPKVSGSGETHYQVSALGHPALAATATAPNPALSRMNPRCFCQST